ncbi:MAG: NERD domain-containing protein [Piscinibacter sp.]|uniref:NERD domain-containing protein/DEAD/DEAH box helicase n=1 Tax=Piscinibacter sp. TaxID=1903157 RepID=UPI00258CB3DC|nr:NERD domain-containing protein/DEAD/DEAH box helicase [Piscinibacter sp.]MCW5665001.1 NERD domain-containing protein [Piscinibacter sp.]
MALLPQGASQVDARCNPGERRVLQQLRRCLGDDYLVWHDVPVGPRARQPDFVILSPRQGLLLLEVKDWKRSTLVAATRDRVELATPRGRVTEANPLRRARDHVLELVDLMKADPLLVHPAGPFAGKLIFPWGYGAVFSHLRAAELAGSDFHELFPPHQVLLRDDLDEAVDPGEFQKRLWGMFSVSYPHTLTLPQRDRIRWHLFPEVRLPAQGALAFDETEAPAAPALPDLMEVMDLQQEQIARTLGEGHRVIHGAAGSGKTMILVFRACQLAAAARPDRPVLVLCFNRTLADRIAALLKARGVAGPAVQVRTFHAWCADMVDSYSLYVPPLPDREAHWRALVEVVERSLATGFVPSGQYAALLVDEAHDFEEAWLRMAVRLVDPASRSLLVLYDDAQSIYQRQRRSFSFASVGIEARGRTSVLRLNYRNTAEVLALAMQCARALLQGAGEPAGDDGVPLVQPASAGRRGALPVLIEARDEAEEAELLAERVAEALASGRSASDIAVLCRAKALMRPIERALRRRGIALQSMAAEAFRRFDWQRPSVKLLTLHSAKGLEFPDVFVAGLQALPMKDESLDDAARLLYVAMTRATHTLVLSAHGASPVVERVREGVAAVARTWAPGTPA